jgi:hypothetical protein
MKVQRKTYESLSPVPRAIAAYLALNRRDYTEAEKLISAAPPKQGQGRSFLALGQAIDVYNSLCGQLAIRALHKLLEFTNDLAYCEGWLDAGGNPENFTYLKRYRQLDTLGAETRELSCLLEAVKEAAREWADLNKIPLEVFSEPMAILNLGGKTSGVAADEETLGTMRELFDSILLTW